MTLHTLGTPKPGKYDPNLAERLNKEAEDDVRRAEQKKLEEKHRGRAPALPPPAPQAISTVFNIGELPGGYRIDGVQYHNGIYSFAFAEKPLPSRTQGGHAKHAQRARADFRAANAPMVYAIARTLYQNRRGPQKELVDNARRALDDVLGMGAPWINTLSMAVFESGLGPDEIVHDCGLQTQYTCRGNLTGPDGLITKRENQALQYVQALLDTNNTPREVNMVFEWIADYPAFASRLKKTPNKRQEGVVVLGVGVYNYFYLDSAFDGDERPALGVRLRKLDGAP